MKTWTIPLYKIFSDNEDLKKVSDVIKRGMTWAIGPEIEEFEKLLAKYVGSKYCVTFNSGTSALHAALLAIGIKPQNEILVPSFTFIATANSVMMVNAKPKFVDIEKETLGLDPTHINHNINKKTKAIIPVHYAGLPCKIEEIARISKQKKIKLIEDSAESLGASVNNKNVGQFGDLSIFSFAGNKVLTTGEGGAITTNSKKYFEKLRLVRSHGRIETRNYFLSVEKPQYVTLGYNWRMSAITAALGISQLNKLEKLISLRRRHAKYLSSKLKKFDNIMVPNEPYSYRHVYQLYSIQLPNSQLRNKLMRFLNSKGIMSKIFFYPIHLTKFYQKLGYKKINNLKETETISNKILSLPMFPALKNEELNFICDSVAEFMENEHNH